jgi:hypothetical protein
MRIEKGNIIQWVSRAGKLRGYVRDITLDLNAAEEVCAWMMIVDVVDEDDVRQSNVYLNATNGYLKMMKVEVL